MTTEIHIPYSVTSIMEEVSLNDADEVRVIQDESIPMVHGRQSSVIDLSGRCSEIIVHEVDSDSDAGSEDVELLPHRYATNSDDCRGHLYVNRLSLATELYRTHEPLPYGQDLKLGEPSCETEDDFYLKGNSSTNSHSEKDENKPQNSELSNGCAIQKKESGSEQLKLPTQSAGSFCIKEMSPLLTNNIQQCPCVVL